MTALAQTARLLQFVRFSHTVFAMPFALGAMVVAANGLPPARTILLIVLAMVFARTAAMTFNRLADWRLDQRNPRTEGRHRLIPRSSAILACAISSALFVLSAWMINPLCFVLSPVALAIVFFYSFTKRFTHAAQFFLGLALAVAPVGAWLAVTGSFSPQPLILALAVVLWLAGFDSIYATQDYEVDKREGLKSMVVWLGIPRALRVAQFLHAAAWLALAGFGWSAGLGVAYWLGLAAILGLLIYEHRVARSLDVAAINAAFFQSNAWIGGVFVLATFLDRLA
ncbi:MAG: putative 4-hydroxybenzoate polyprenyltransferase [Terrimicrobiaceae bacterium]|nr:putative 4-hydroxybenzoate polyprenyltransferase [Terrimicrobiaceae bacterium]